MGPDNATWLVVGTGDFVYDVFRPWGVLPAGWTFGTISHVAVDSKDHVYFYQRKDPPVLVVDGAVSRRPEGQDGAGGQARLAVQVGLHEDGRLAAPQDLGRQR